MNKHLLHLSKAIINETLVRNTQLNRKMLVQVLANSDKEDLALVHCRTGRWKSVIGVYKFRKVPSGAYYKVYFTHAIECLEENKWVVK